MDLDQLQSVRDRERQTDKLQQLRESFYTDAVEFIEELREERDAAAATADDPFGSPEVSRLTDRIQTAERTVEAIYEKRIGKLVKAATFAAADLPAEAEGMTAEEDDLFETLVDDIQANRERVLGPLHGATSPHPGGTAEDASESPTADTAPAPPEPPSEPPAETEPGGDSGSDEDVSAAAVMGQDTAPPGTGAEPASEGPATEDEGANDVDEDDAEDVAEGGAGESEGDTLPGDASSSTADEGDAAGNTGGSESVDVERSLVRITADVGEILGVDQREYELSTDDVVTLPAANAEGLIEQDAAERLE